MPGFDVQRVIAAYQAGAQLKRQKELQAKDDEMRSIQLEDLDIRRKQLKFEQKKAQLGLLHNSPAEETQVGQPGMSTPQPTSPEGGSGPQLNDFQKTLPTNIQELLIRNNPRTQTLPIAQGFIQEAPLPEVTFGPESGFDQPFTVRPQSSQELTHQTSAKQIFDAQLKQRDEMRMKAFESGLKREENAISIEPSVLRALGIESVGPIAVDSRIAPTLLSQSAQAQRQNDQQLFTADENALNRQQQNTLAFARQAFDERIKRWDLEASNQKALSGEASKVMSIASTMIPELEQLRNAFNADYSGALKGIVFGTDRKLSKIVDQVADKVGRLRSGGAINKDEEARFRRQIASFPDLIFGRQEDAIAAIDALMTEAQQVASRIQPGQTQPNAETKLPPTMTIGGQMFILESDGKYRATK